MVQLATPLALTQLAQVAISTTDVIMMGWLGAGGLAAGGLAMFLFNLLRTMGFGMVVGVSNLVAQDEKHRDHILAAALVIASLCALIAGMMMVYGPELLLLIGQDSGLVSATADYLLWMAPGMFPCFWFYCYRGISVGERQTGILLTITLVSVLVNGVLNYVFIKGLFGLPPLGLSGIAFASSLVFLFSFVAMALLVHRAKTIHLARAFADGIGDPMRKLLKLGFPTAASYGSEAGFFVVVALLMGMIGTEALAAHTLVNQIIYIIFMISIGLSHATSVGISEARGGKSTASLAIAGRTGFLVGLVLMMVIGVAYWIRPDVAVHLIMLKSGDQNPAVLTLAIQLMAVAAYLQIFDCLQNIGVGAMRGLGRAGISFWFTIAGYWLIGLPAAYGMGIANAGGAVGIWQGLAIGLAATAVLQMAGFEFFQRRITGRLAVE
ncbi:MATE family multidrug resistance protein [Aestuariispira insulae]|uniref:MATE family multidrug resistance protein n=1 Tax=Aestuariispira insulae TaxID=1461337 RepID=A0A3D9H5X9_9PROT|nr:MATE family multidrug resistance protein [Aestuariispira insulae]